MIKLPREVDDLEDYVSAEVREWNRKVDPQPGLRVERDGLVGRRKTIESGLQSSAAVLDVDVKLGAIQRDFALHPCQHNVT